MATLSQPQAKMSVEEFLTRYEDAPAGRFELVDGEVIEMPPERTRHNLVKLTAAIVLGDAVKREGLPCTVFTDGIGVRINEYTVRGPDASVQCAAQDPESMIFSAPLVVVEVVSPSSERDDTGRKLVEYFSVASIQHYLIVDPWKNVVVHHARAEAARIDTRILGSGDIDLSPPGIRIAVEQLLGSA